MVIVQEAQVTGGPLLGTLPWLEETYLHRKARNGK